MEYLLIAGNKLCCCLLLADMKRNDMRMNVNKIIRYSMQLAMLKQLKSKNMITEEEYEKILRTIRKDYQVISDISP